MLAVSEMLDKGGDAVPICEVLGWIAGGWFTNRSLSNVRAKDSFPTTNDVLRPNAICNIDPYWCRHLRGLYLLFVVIDSSGAGAKICLCQKERSTSSHPAVDPGAGLAKRRKYSVMSKKYAALALGRIELGNVD